MAEWILYVEPEMIIDAPDFTFPFEFYAGRDLVRSSAAWLSDLAGQWSCPLEGHMCAQAAVVLGFLDLSGLCSTLPRPTLCTSQTLMAAL